MVVCVLDLDVKHILARSTKRFFGCGPAGQVVTAIQGDLVIFAAEFMGPGILTALPQQPFGRLAMRYIADLYSREVAPELAALARQQFGVTLVEVLSDLDHETGRSLGIALLDQPLPMPDQAAEPELARAVEGALVAALETDVPPAGVTVRCGPAALVLRAPYLVWPMGATADAVFAGLAAREAFRSRLRPGLVAAAAGAGLAPGPVFVAHSERGLVAGVLLT